MIDDSVGACRQDLDLILSAERINYYMLLFSDLHTSAHTHVHTERERETNVNKINQRFPIERTQKEETLKIYCRRQQSANQAEGLGRGYTRRGP